MNIIYTIISIEVYIIIHHTHYHAANYHFDIISREKKGQNMKRACQRVTIKLQQEICKGQRTWQDNAQQIVKLISVSFINKISQYFTSVITLPKEANVKSEEHRGKNHRINHRRYPRKTSLSLRNFFTASSHVEVHISIIIYDVFPWDSRKEAAKQRNFRCQCVNVICSRCKPHSRCELY